jgi:hypothetical protein
VPAIDYKRELKSLYAPPADKVVVVDVPALAYLMIDGAGDPNTAPAYAQAVEALYGLAYAVKFLVKRQGGEDFTVMPLEGLWWAADMARFSVERKGDWQWTMMLMQPPPVTADLVEAARASAARKKAPAMLAEVRLATLIEGLAAQILHLGPYAAEAPTIARLHHFIDEQGYAPRGHHHELYLGDPRRTAPEKLRTIVRQPIAPR